MTKDMYTIVDETSGAELFPDNSDNSYNYHISSTSLSSLPPLELSTHKEIEKAFFESRMQAKRHRGNRES